MLVLCNNTLTQACPAPLLTSAPQDASKHPNTHWEGGSSWNCCSCSETVSASNLLMVIFSPEHNVTRNPFVLLLPLMPATASCQGALYPHWALACKLALITSGKQGILYALSSQGKMIHSMMAPNIIYKCTICTKWHHLMSSVLDERTAHGSWRTKFDNPDRSHVLMQKAS